MALSILNRNENFKFLTHFADKFVKMKTGMF